MNPNFFSKIPKSPDSPSGFLLYGEYTPIEILGEGGMGRVFLVRSLLTEQRFALKCAKYSTDSDRKSFLAELQTWIDIPEHPNIVACRFFRTMIDDIVIFADYVEQGSLKDWIDSKQLYKGSSQDALERILGIAIQSAWALYCLHEIGAVHQDVKPANILMSITHDAGAYTLTPQITDFGLTRARARAGERYEPNGNIYNSSIRGTRAYWSPEQSQGNPVDHKTDIWSWGLTVMEMFTGELSWISGIGAASVLDEYVRNNGFIREIPTMPGNLADLLRTCFHQNPFKRPHKFLSVVDSLKDIYRQCLGIEYSRDLRKFENRSSPKNEGISRITTEGVSWIDPQIWLEKALDYAGTPNKEKTAELESHKQDRNKSIVSDIASYDYSKRKIIQIMESNNRDDLKPILASICLNKSLIHQTSGDIYGAINECDDAINYLKDYALKYEEVEATIRFVHANFQKAKILQDFTSDHTAAFEAFSLASEAIELLVYKQQRRDLEDYLGFIYSYMARSSQLAGKSAESIDIHNKVIRIKEKLFNEDKRITSAVDLITAYTRKSMVLSSIDRNSEAADICDKAIQIYDRVNIDGLNSNLDSELADIFATKGSAIYNMGDIQNSLFLFSKAIEIKETLIQQKSSNSVVASLADLYELKADILSATEDFLSAIELYKKATAIIEILIHQNESNDLLENIATIHIKMAESMRGSGNNSEAYKLCEKAISIQEELINKKGKSNLSKILAGNYCLKAEILCDLGEMRQAIEWYYEALAIRDRFYTHNYNSEIAKDLASTYTNIGIVYTAMEELEEAELILEKAIEIQELLHREGSSHEVLGDLAISKGHHALLLLSHGEIEELEERCAQAMQEIDFSLKTLQQEFARTGRNDLKEAYNLIFWKFKENMGSTTD